jgi:hypothetical protein
LEIPPEFVLLPASAGLLVLPSASELGTLLLPPVKGLLLLLPSPNVGLFVLLPISVSGPFLSLVPPANRSLSAELLSPPSVS